MTIWKPTAEECKAIKKAASREGGVKLGLVLLEPGIRHNTKDDAMNIAACAIEKGAFNIALVSNDPEWGDTDLSDYGAWEFFRKGVALTDDGRAIVDFYIRKRFASEWEDSLWGNVTVYYENGRIARIHGYPGEYPTT